MGDQDDLRELPQAPKNLTGESVDRDKAGKYDIKVSNASGYLCHIHVEVHPLTCQLLHKSPGAYCSVLYHIERQWSPRKA